MIKSYYSKTLLVAISTFFLSACLTTQSTSSERTSDVYGTKSDQDAEYYLAESRKRQGSEQAIWKLRAASAYAQQDRFSSAYNTLITFQPTQLTPERRNAYYLLKGESALRQQKGFEAIRALQAVNHPEQEQTAWNRHYQLLTADALSVNKRYADAAVTRLEAHKLITNPSQLDSQYQTAWKELSQSPLGALESKLRRAEDDSVRGWLELAIVQQRHQSNGRLLSEGLRNWTDQYTNHPAMGYMPSESIRVRDSDFSTPRQVALIVPLSGKLGMVGAAIRDGFVSGYYQSRLGRGELPNIKVYDSASGDSMERIFQEAMADGVELVVGPLLKNNIDQLMRFEQMPITTMVLNRIDSSYAPSNMYQFGLPVEDEAAQIARYAIRKGQLRAFIINADPNVGKRATRSFVETYEDLGGTVVQIAEITKNQDPKEAITRLLGVDQIESRSKELQETLDLELASSGQGSSNADAIFLISGSKRARIIKPYLNYYYAYNLPVYATSSIYSGTNNSRVDNDLSGIMFTDAPWMLGTSKEIRSLKKELSKTMPQSLKGLGRFYALGHDAFALIPELGQLSAVPESAVEGLTGVLSMDSYGRIQRQLAWGRYEKGQVKAYNER